MFQKCSTPSDVKQLYRTATECFRADHDEAPEVLALLREAKELAIEAMGKPKEKKEAPKKQWNDKKPNKPAPNKVRDGDPRLEFLAVMQAYIDAHPRFDASFYDSVMQQFDKNHYMSEAQYEKIKGVYDKFEMDEWYDDYMEDDQ